MALIFGLAIGSFLNVVIYRLPRGESLVWPRSACPGCGHVLGVLDLFPLLSFLFLGGKCRYCSRSISWQYPLVEAMTGVSYCLLAIRYGIGLEFLVFAIYAALLIAVAGIDLHHMVIPDVLSLPGMGLGLLYGLARGRLAESLLGAAVGGGTLLAVYYATLFLLKKEGLGLGDAKLLAMIGALLGWRGALFTILLGSLFGSIIGLIMIVGGRLKRGEPMPFGPYLAAAGLILAVWPWESWLGLLFVP
ncbi:MAG: prepilin peptidase [Bacteroidota bacterium]